MLCFLYSQRKSRIWRISSNWWGMNTNTSPTQAKSPSRKARRATRQSSSYAHPATCTLTPWTTVVTPTKSFRACLPSLRSMKLNELTACCLMTIMAASQISENNFEQFAIPLRRGGLSWTCEATRTTSRCLQSWNWGRVSPNALFVFLHFINQ